MQDDAAGLTEELAARAMALRFADLPAPVVALAGQCLRDMLACALAGADDPLVGVLADLAAEEGGAGQATLIGRSARAPRMAAARINGAAGHALDFDDVNLAMPGHPSVAVLPALLALAEARHASGAAVIEAFVAGYELQCRLGAALAPGHYDGLGFHATATIGSFGAAAACARLLGLDPARAAMALGIAATGAAGLKSMFGTMCKPLHAGMAAETGLRAALMAARGFTSRADAIECRQGFAATHSPDFVPARARQTPPGGFHLLANLFKYHAACYLTHGAIEAARRLRAQGVQPDDIASLALTVDANSDRVCNIPRPQDGLQTKFSLRHTTAMALSGIETGALASYSTANAADPALVALAARITLRLRPGLPPAAGMLEVTTRDGRTLRSEHDAGIAATDIAEQGRRLEAKFAALATPVLGEARMAALSRHLASVAEMADIAPLMAATAPSP